MKRKLMSLALACFVLVDHLIWFSTGFAESVAVEYVMASVVFRTCLLVCAIASLRRPAFIHMGFRALSLYAFASGGLVVTAYALAVDNPAGPWGNLAGFWRLPVDPPLSAVALALACVGYLAGCSILLPRSRNLW